jgi:outer membrane protein TolC
MMTRAQSSVVSLLRVVAVWTACALAGCHQGDPKARIDDEVYKSIDRQWKDDFGPKNNYRVSDVPASPNDVHVDRPLPGQLGTLTLPQAVALATAYNVDYQKRREALYVRALDLRLAKDQFEPHTFGILDGGLHSERGGGYRGKREDDVLGAEAGVGFNRLLADGTRLSLSLAQAWEEVLTGKLRGGLTSILGASASIPLLRGSSRDVVMAGLTQAERDLLYEVRTFNQFRKGLVVSVIGDYYHMLVLLDHIQNAKANRQAMGDLLHVATALAQAGHIPSYEADRIRQEILDADNVCLQAQQEYDQRLDQFKLKLGIPTTVRFQLDSRELDAIKASSLPCPNLTEQEIIDTAMARRLDVANEADRVIDARRDVAVAQDRMKGKLNLVVSTAAPSNHFADRETLKPYQSDVGLGLDAKLPLDNDVARENKYRLALLGVERQERLYGRTVDLVTAEVRESYRKLKEAAEQHRIYKEGMALAQKRVENTNLLLRYERAPTRRVLEALKDRFDAEDRSMKTLADYATATLEFYRDTGLLQVQPDGMWKL